MVPVLPKPVFAVVPPPPNKLPPAVLVEPNPDVALLLPKPVDAPKPVFVVVLLAVDPNPPNPVAALLLLFELPKILPPELFAGCPKAGFAAPNGDELEVDPKPDERGDLVSFVMVVIVEKLYVQRRFRENEGRTPQYLTSKC